MNESLKHCPFCGGQWHILKCGYKDDDGYMGECLRCRLLTPIFKTSEEAVKYLNNRVVDELYAY